MKIFGVMYVLSWTYSYVICMWGTVQYVLLLSHCLIAISALCLLLLIML